MLLLYHEFTKNARTVFLRGIFLCVGIRELDDKIFYFCNFGSEKMELSSFM